MKIVFLSIIVFFYSFSAQAQFEGVFEKLVQQYQAVKPMEVFSNQLAGDGRSVIVEIYDEVTRRKDGHVGSGFFLEEDFPVLHTVKHVTDDLPSSVKLLIRDRNNKLHSIEIKNLEMRIHQDPRHDYATIDLHGLEKKLHGKVRPLKRALQPIKLFEQAYSLGFQYEFESGSHVQVYSKITSSFCLAGVPGLEKDFNSDLVKKFLPTRYQEFTQAPYPVAPYAGEQFLPIGDQKISLAEYQRPHGTSGSFDYALCYYGAVKPGMSGGPIVNQNFEVIGINNAGGKNVIFGLDLSSENVKRWQH